MNSVYSNTKPTPESTNNAIRAVTTLAMDAGGLPLAPITNAFGEVESHDVQVQNAKHTIARFASVYCQ